MRNSTRFLTLLTLVITSMFLIGTVYAGDGQGEQKGFVDLNGDGINDNMRDDDADGIPNCVDANYVMTADGSNNQNSNQNSNQNKEQYEKQIKEQYKYKKQIKEQSQVKEQANELSTDQTIKLSTDQTTEQAKEHMQQQAKEQTQEMAKLLLCWRTHTMSKELFQNQYGVLGDGAGGGQMNESTNQGSDNQGHKGGK